MRHQVASREVGRIARLKTKIGKSSAMNRFLMAEVIEAACPSYLNAGARESRIHGYVAAGAWTSALSALINLELPNWCIRRLVQDDGSWWCAMNECQPVYWRDDEVDERHDDLDLAIATAFLTALCRSMTTAVAPARETVESRVLALAHLP
jgi:hypothetical protein